MYSGSQTSAKDMNLLFPSSSTFKNSSEGGGGDNLQRNREASMDVNLFHRRQPNHQPNQQQFNSGLMRYRSAPSSLLEKLINGEDEGGCDNFIPPPTHSSPSEAESIFARFMSIAGNDSSDLREINVKSAVNNRNPPQFMEQETIEENNVFPPTSQMMFQNPSIPSSQPQQNSLQRQNSLNPTESPYRGVNSVNLDQNPSPLKMGSATNSTSNLIRHSSSPAGLFTNLNVENGYPVMRGMGTTAGNSRLKSQMSFPSRPPTSSGLMSQISEIESEGGNSGEEGSLSNGNNRFIPGFPVASWDDGLENYTGVKRARDINNKMMNPSEAQSGEVGNHTTGLTHHFSLPKNSAEMAAILQYQDSVPCKIRAKRGCATHPRSIAERVRRTRISERMRKLQELVPNMDKQTNTADMLDLAVEYIKDLQTQVKTLNNNQVNCTCSNKQKL